MRGMSGRPIAKMLTPCICGVVLIFRFYFPNAPLLTQVGEPLPSLADMQSRDLATWTRTIPANVVDLYTAT